MSKKILIVDDEPAMLSVLADKFTQQGFEVLLAKDGLEGLEVSLKSHPDLILLDIVMPVMDGMTMLGKLRADSWGKSASILLLTNLSGAEKVDESRSYGVHDYLIKCDWTLTDIVKKVNEKLGKKSK